MADKTITALTATTSAASSDEIPMWVAGSAVTRKITKANFLTGYGALATASTWTALQTFSAGVSLGNETLSAYRIGTWTPAFTFGGAATGITYASRTATYVKIGALVMIVADIRLSNKGSATGLAEIGGLPFASSSNPNSLISIRWVSMAANYVDVCGVLADASSGFGVYGATAATASLAQLTDAAFANGTILQLSGCYRAA